MLASAASEVSTHRTGGAWSALCLAAVLGLLMVAGVSPAAATTGGDTTGTTLDEEALRDLHRQLDEPAEEAGEAEGEESAKENQDLWEEYQQVKRSLGERRSSERVEIGGNVLVEENELITGDVVAIGGSVDVFGHVDGDAVSVGGQVRIHPGAEVTGDAVAVGGNVELDDEGVVQGEVVSIDLGFPIPGAIGLPLIKGPFWRHHGYRGAALLMSLIWLMVTLGLGLLFCAIAGTRLDGISRRLEAEPGQSFLVGLLATLGTPIATFILVLLLLVTIIGILLIPVLLIVLLLMSFAGLLAVSIAVGRRFAVARGVDTTLPVMNRSPYFLLFTGFIALHAVLILGHVIGTAVPALGPLALLLRVLGKFILIFASIVGFGALLTSRFGTQLGAAAAVTTGPGLPPPPPVPGGPRPSGPPPPPDPEAPATP
jgi:hypothetical protein